MNGLLSRNLVRDDVERLVPADSLVTGDAAVLRISLAIRVEVDTLHRIKNPVRRINHRLGVLPVRGQRGFARRRECLAPGLDAPRLRIIVVEADWCHTDDLAVLDVNGERAAICHIAVTYLAVRHFRAELPANLQHVFEHEHEPERFVLGPVERHAELLRGIDAAELVVGVRERSQRELHGLEADDHLRVRVDATSR